MFQGTFGYAWKKKLLNLLKIFRIKKFKLFEKKKKKQKAIFSKGEYTFGANAFMSGRMKTIIIEN